MLSAANNIAKIFVWFSLSTYPQPLANKIQVPPINDFGRAQLASQVPEVSGHFHDEAQGVEATGILDANYPPESMAYMQPESSERQASPPGSHRREKIVPKKPKCAKPKPKGQRLAGEGTTNLNPATKRGVVPESDDQGEKEKPKKGKKRHEAKSRGIYGLMDTTHRPKSLLEMAGELPKPNSKAPEPCEKREKKVAKKPKKPQQPGQQHEAQGVWFEGSMDVNYPTTEGPIGVSNDRSVTPPGPQSRDFKEKMTDTKPTPAKSLKRGLTLPEPEEDGLEKKLKKAKNEHENHSVNFDEHMTDAEPTPGDLPEEKPKKATNKHQSYAEDIADEESASVNLPAMEESLLKRSGAPLDLEEEAKENKAAKRSKKKPDGDRQIGRYANVEYLDLTAQVDARMKEIEEEREKCRQETAEAQAWSRVSSDIWRGGRARKEKE